MLDTLGFWVLVGIGVLTAVFGLLAGTLLVISVIHRALFGDPWIKTTTHPHGGLRSYVPSERWPGLLKLWGRKR